MAHAIHKELTGTELDSPPVTLLYVRSTELDVCLLDERVEAIAARYADDVQLHIYDPRELPVDVRQRYPNLAGPTPTILVLRSGEVVGAAIGSRLPAREVERAVIRAVEWPS